jgi:succinate dehydrogenase/fumarate reductase flavoprotein subunit
VPQAWDVEADVVVVGFGAVGACTALEAAGAQNSGARPSGLRRLTPMGSQVSLRAPGPPCHRHCLRPWESLAGLV